MSLHIKHCVKLKMFDDVIADYIHTALEFHLRDIFLSFLPLTSSNTKVYALTRTVLYIYADS